MIKHSLLIILFLGTRVESQWLTLANVDVERETIENAGPRISIVYDLLDESISEKTPAYIFIRYKRSARNNWQFLPMKCLRGTGFDIVNSPGRKELLWWNAPEAQGETASELEIKLRAIKMAKIPAGKFVKKTVRGGGALHTGSKEQPDSMLPTYFMAQHEVTVSMYTDYLNETGGNGYGWRAGMMDPKKCGIIRTGKSPVFRYSVHPGRENFPVNQVTWYEAQKFLDWCGLRLPTELEYEKAVRGGLFLDGDQRKQSPNPMPERAFPWGSEFPDKGSETRCNNDNPDDGYKYTAPVGHYKNDKSPYGIYDLAGNVSEWTLDWYTTVWLDGMDGYRVLRGGSWLSFPEGCDAVTGATSLPNKGLGIFGFRGVRGDN